jgi:hypothetical protein
MEHNKIASIGDENMILCHDNNTEEFSMTRAEAFEGRGMPAYGHGGRQRL